MISLIEALGYRCLRHVHQPLQPFHVLVGPNSSGKSTFLDVIGFLQDLVNDGLTAAIEARSSNFHDLCWRHRTNGFEFAIEARIPEDCRAVLADTRYDTARYELCVRLDQESNKVGIFAERGYLEVRGAGAAREETEMRVATAPPRTLFSQEQHARDGWLFASNPQHVANPTKPFPDFHVFRSEAKKPPAEVDLVLAPWSAQPALSKVSAPDRNHPISTWLKQLLAEGVQRIALEASHLRQPSPPGKGLAFVPDGSNLPWLVADLKRHHADRHRQWIRHLKTALPDLLDVTTTERPEDRHRYLTLMYGGGLKVPSWMASDGTLRVLALTLLAYLPSLRGVYLVEEPEDGIHPLAIETVFQSLSSIWEAQVLLATHSPVILGLTHPDALLCFERKEDGTSAVVLGSKHPRLADWKGEVDLGTLFASGVLG